MARSEHPRGGRLDALRSPCTGGGVHPWCCALMRAGLRERATGETLNVKVCDSAVLTLDLLHSIVYVVHRGAITEQ